MRWIDGLSMPQRVVAVIALAIALGGAGEYLVSLGGGPGNGWYAYSPLTARLYAPGPGLAPWLRLIIWLALTSIWAVASIRVLRPATASGTRD